MQTPEQLADWARDKSFSEHGFSLGREERLMAMLDLIRQFHYHIIAPDIQAACRKKAGLVA
jgi:hypothetical protein